MIVFSFVQGQVEMITFWLFNLAGLHPPKNLYQKVRRGQQILLNCYKRNDEIFDEPFSPRLVTCVFKRHMRLRDSADNMAVHLAT